jgi:hypothetical protein
MSPQPSRRRPTPAELKAARQKKIVIGGSVLLVALLAFLGPKTFKQLHPAQQNTIPPSMRNAASTTGTTTTPQAVASGPTQLADTDVVTVQPGSGQLVSFGLFKSKDPFVQQLASATPAAATTPSAASAVTPQPAASKQTVTVPSVVTPTPAQTAPTPTVATTPTTPTVSTPAPTPTTPAPTPAPVPSGSAAISTNGHCEVVPANATFPKGDEVFRLVSIAANGQSVKIGVAGGSYQSGASTVTLKKGTPLTLVNTANGVRYRLSLLDDCPATSTGSTPKPAPTAPAPTTTTTATTTTTTTPTTTTTSTVTTPTTTTSTTP